MKISELVGAKSIIGMRKTPGSIGHLLVQKGFTPLGRGSYGEVYLPPGKDYVLKLIEADDVAYLGFIRNAKSSGNVHFPRVIGSPVKVAEFVNAVRLEPLQKWTRTGSDEDEALVWFTWAAQKPDWKSLLDKPNMDRHRRIVSELLQKHPDLEKAMELLRTWKKPGYDWDLHPNNIMMRGGTPVIIDPWMPVREGTMAVDAIRAKLK